MSILSKEAAENLVESGEWRWLTDKEAERLKGLGLDVDGDIDPYSGAVVYTTTAYRDKSTDSCVFHRGIISVNEDITRVSITTFARYPELWQALTDEQKATYCSYNEERLRRRESRSGTARENIDRALKSAHEWASALSVKYAMR